jgi:hypothetical protein
LAEFTPFGTSSPSVFFENTEQGAGSVAYAAGLTAFAEVLGDADEVAAVPFWAALSALEPDPEPEPESEEQPAAASTTGTAAALTRMRVSRGARPTRCAGRCMVPSLVALVVRPHMAGAAGRVRGATVRGEAAMRFLFEGFAWGAPAPRRTR